LLCELTRAKDVRPFRDDRDFRPEWQLFGCATSMQTREDGWQDESVWRRTRDIADGDRSGSLSLSERNKRMSCDRRVKRTIKDGGRICQRLHASASDRKVRESIGKVQFDIVLSKSKKSLCHFAS
jgi:hypothetical protein